MKDESQKNPRKKINTTFNTEDIIAFMWNNLKNESKRVRLKYFNGILRFCKLSSGVLNQPGSTHFRLLVEYTNEKFFKLDSLFCNIVYKKFFKDFYSGFLNDKRELIVLLECISIFFPYFKKMVKFLKIKLKFL